MSCFAFVSAGYPQPMYRWLKDGVPVGDFSSSQFYRFHSTRREDAGSYQCIARNDAGSILSEKSDVVVACKYTHSFDWVGLRLRGETARTRVL